MNNTSCILIVDDDPGVRFMLLRAVEGLGHRAETAGSRSEACARLRGARFDAVISDIQMESPDAGVRLVDDARRLQPDIPFILLTGGPTMATVGAALRSGVCDYLAKPFAIADFISAVDLALGIDRVI